MSLKRKLSESDSEFCDYGEEEESCSVSRSEDVTLVGGSTRKRRRGMIEKKRRDRINDSLAELKRLVPSAVEKSSSTKLEKAEILQMTVDYLKALQSRGDYADPRAAIDYQSMGFRDCVTEVSRYLVAVEGLDIQDPLRLRLMSHLHGYGSRGQAPSWQPSYPVHHYNNLAHNVEKVAHETQPPPPAPFVGPETSAYSRTASVHSSGPAYSHSSGYANYSTFNSLPLPPPATTYLPPNGKPYRPWGAEMAY